MIVADPADTPFHCNRGDPVTPLGKVFVNVKSAVVDFGIAKRTNALFPYTLNSPVWRKLICAFSVPLGFTPSKNVSPLLATYIAKPAAFAAAATAFWILIAQGASVFCVISITVDPPNTVPVPLPTRWNAPTELFQVRLADPPNAPELLN